MSGCSSCEEGSMVNLEIMFPKWGWITHKEQFPNDAGLDTRCKFPDDAGLHTSQVESSAVRVLVALVKAERKRAAALENVAEFLKKRKEQSDALFTQAKEEMEEARNKLAEAEQARRLLLSKTVVNTKFPS